MKRQVFILSLCTLFYWSCQNKSEYDQLDEQTLSILLSNGDISGYNDPALLIGEWDFVKFAYAADGNKIKHVANISRSKLTIQPVTEESDIRCDHDSVDQQWFVNVLNWFGMNCSITGNLIDLKFCGSSYMLVHPPHEEYDIMFALENAHSFVVMSDKLFIYFEDVDEQWKNHFIFKEKKNLLILKKR